MTHDLDQSLELIGGILALFLLLPFFMAWLEETLEDEKGGSGADSKPGGGM